MALHDVGAAADLRRGPIVAAIGYTDIVVWRVGDALHATDRWCPHARGDLSGAAPSGSVVTCGDHGWDFDVATGGCVKKPGRYILPTYPCVVRDDRVLVELPDNAPGL